MRSSLPDGAGRDRAVSEAMVRAVLPDVKQTVKAIRSWWERIYDPELHALWQALVDGRVAPKALVAQRPVMDEKERQDRIHLPRTGPPVETREWNAPWVTASRQAARRLRWAGVPKLAETVECWLSRLPFGPVGALKEEDHRQIDEVAKEICKALTEWCVQVEQPPAPPAGPAEAQQHVPEAVGRAEKGGATRQATAPKDAASRIVAALLQWHQYSTESLNCMPIGRNELARKARVSQGAVSAFFRANFGKDGHRAYRRFCADKAKLVPALRLLAGDTTPAILDKPLFTDPRDQR